MNPQLEWQAAASVPNKIGALHANSHLDKISKTRIFTSLVPMVWMEGLLRHEHPDIAQIDGVHPAV
jgi:hypothetical protein